MVVDDSKDITELYRAVFDTEDDMRCVGTATDAEDLVEKSQSAGADIILLDLTMEGKDSLEAVRELVRSAPETRVVIFSGYDDSDTVAQAFEAGARGFISKHADPLEIVNAVRQVARGELYTPSSKRAELSQGMRF